MRFGHVEIFTRNQQRSLDFYLSVLGFELSIEQSAQLAWIKRGDLEILLRSGAPPATSADTDKLPT